MSVLLWLQVCELCFILVHYYKEIIHTHTSLFQNRCRLLKNVLFNAGIAFLGSVTAIKEQYTLIYYKHGKIRYRTQRWKVAKYIWSSTILTVRRILRYFNCIYNFCLFVLLLDHISETNIVLLTALHLYDSIRLLLQLHYTNTNKQKWILLLVLIFSVNSCMTLSCNLVFAHCGIANSSEVKVLSTADSPKIRWQDFTGHPINFCALLILNVNMWEHPGTDL